ncbi:MAG: putative toxin-antitoxin system toxin component, PIN family [Terracidiphilus sp.]|jgi:putative PIN family toxin of toxin-antitoxin system
MRAVADTNVLISAFLFGGLPRVFVDLRLAGGFPLVTSGALLNELEEKLLGKFAVPKTKAEGFLSLLTRNALVVHPDFRVDAVPGDPDDNRVLECAVDGQADFIVSGDKHLLRLGSHAGIAILTVRQFLQTVGFPLD